MVLETAPSSSPPPGSGRLPSLLWPQARQLRASAANLALRLVATGSSGRGGGGSADRKAEVGAEAQRLGQRGGRGSQL